MEKTSRWAADAGPWAGTQKPRAAAGLGCLGKCPALGSCRRGLLLGMTTVPFPCLWVSEVRTDCSVASLTTLSCDQNSTLIFPCRCGMQLFTVQLLHPQAGVGLAPEGHTASSLGDMACPASQLQRPLGCAQCPASEQVHVRNPCWNLCCSLLQNSVLLGATGHCLASVSMGRQEREEPGRRGFPPRHGSP